jgi:rhamnose transport system permease protein
VSRRDAATATAPDLAPPAAPGPGETAAAATSNLAAARVIGQELILCAILALALIVLAWRSEQFLTLANLLNQGRLMAEVGLVALPMTFIIVTGGIDLSVGSILGLCAILLGVFWKNLGLPLELAVFLALLVGAAAGAVNGLIITRVGVPPLIATLATLALYRGLAEGISQARSVRGYPEGFYLLGQGDVLGVPTQLWLLGLAILVFGIALARTTFGRTLYAIGSNETAARFSGLPVDRAKLAIYTLSGLTAGLAAWIFVSRVSTTRSDMGTGLELDVIAAVVLGGTSIFGGTGTILGTMLGVVLVQLLKNGLALTGVKGDATIVVIGAVLILSILLTNLARRRDGEA